MTTEPGASPFTMLGSADAAACEGDSCLVPLAVSGVGTAGASIDPGASAEIDIEPTADEAKAASARAVAAALDEGASL